MSKSFDLKIRFNSFAYDLNQPARHKHSQQARRLRSNLLLMWLGHREKSGLFPFYHWTRHLKILSWSSSIALLLASERRRSVAARTPNNVHENIGC